MGLIHLMKSPIPQGTDINGCWAASFAWWLQAVLNRKETFEDILLMYQRWTIDKENEESENFGALSELGVMIMFNDNRFRIVGQYSDTSKLNSKLVNDLLNISPVLIAYYEPKVDGYHMNVLVCRKNLVDLTDGIVVMDPAFNKFQKRTLDYYRKYNRAIYLGYYMRQSAPEPVYAYESDY